MQFKESFILHGPRGKADFMSIKKWLSQGTWSEEEGQQKKAEHGKLFQRDDPFRKTIVFLAQMNREDQIKYSSVTWLKLKVIFFVLILQNEERVNIQH